MKTIYSAKAASIVMSEVLVHMQKLTGLDREKLIRAEAGSIIKRAAGMTKQAKLPVVQIGARYKAAKRLGMTRGQITVNTGRRAPTFGRVWAVSTGINTRSRFRMLRGPASEFESVGRVINYHWMDADWARYGAMTDRYYSELLKFLPNSERATGLARQSWIQIADSLGIRLEEVPGAGISPAAIAKARKSTSIQGKSFVNGRGATGGTEDFFYATLINTLPYWERIRLDKVLAIAISGRINFFLTNMNLGVFKSMDTIAKAYPGFKVVNGYSQA